jgi:UTP--glucose-1-phosphate uridylyltransferase
MTVRKAVIPAAGWGTRLLPASKAVPKELLPLIDKPVIQFAVEEAAASGIFDVILVTAPGKGAIEDYFEPSVELEAILRAKGDTARLEQVTSVSRLAKIHSVLQKEQLGLGHAVLMAKGLVGNEPFAVFLPDDVIDAPVPALRQLLDVHERYGSTVLAVKRVEREEVSRYGIIDADEVAPRTHRVKGMVEKPRLEDAPSRLAIIGRYVLTPEIFERLENVEPGAIGEIQLTDGIAGLLEDQEVYALEYEGDLLDAGTVLGMLKSSVQMALKRPEIAEQFRPWLEKLLRE